MCKWKGSISADLNLPDKIIDLNAIGFRTKGLCIGGKRKHWFGFDFLKLSILIYVQLFLLISISWHGIWYSLTP